MRAIAINTLANHAVRKCANPTTEKVMDQRLTTRVVPQRPHRQPHEPSGQEMSGLTSARSPAGAAAVPRAAPPGQHGADRRKRDRTTAQRTEGQPSIHTFEAAVGA